METNPTLRLAEPEDAAAIAGIYAPYCTAAITSFEEQAPDDAEMAARIANTLRQYPWLVAVDGGAVAGYAYASRHRDRAAYRWAVDVTAYVHDGWQRRGVGRRLYGALLAVLRTQGYYRAYAGIALPNPASVGLHEAMGFEPLGIYRGIGFKLGEWRDVGWWELRLQEQAAVPVEPRSMSSLSRAEVEALLEAHA
jgi:phosphinothricin acetyltransferase